MKKKILSTAVTVSLIAAVVLCVVIITQILSVGYVSFFGKSLFRVATGSMEPTIPVGSILVSSRVETEELKKGDIICFRSKEAGMLGQVITHRITDILEDAEGNLCFETRGDANMVTDGYYVTEENLIGEVIYYTKEGNFFANLFTLVTSKTGFFLCIVLPILLISGLILNDSVKSIRKELNKALEEIREEVNQKEVFTPEEYQEMVERLKQELLEEVKQVDRNNEVEEETKTE